MASHVLWIKRSSYKGLVYGSVAVHSNMYTTKTTDDLKTTEDNNLYDHRLTILCLCGGLCIYIGSCIF